MASTSPGYSITVRAEAPSAIGATADLAAAVMTAGGSLTALDVVESGPDLHRGRRHLRRDRRRRTPTRSPQSIEDLPGVQVRKVSDRTFLLHLGGKIEVVPKVPLKHRDDLSRAYTPGVARVCLAIAEEPGRRPPADHQAQHRRGRHRRLRRPRAWATSDRPRPCR